MLRSIFKPSFLLPVLCIFVSPTNVHRRVVGKEYAVDLAPQLSLANDRRITDVGSTSRATAATSGTGATYIDLFERLDILHTNVELLAAFFLFLIYKTLTANYGRWIFLTTLASRPRVILHCEPDFQNQLSQQNRDTLILALQKAHIHAVYLWLGNPLSDQEIVSGRFSGGHWQSTAPPWASNERSLL